MKNFCRHTNLASLIHILSNKNITLLNPATWDDRNDAYFMSEYKRLKHAQTVLALCFSEQHETYHHWNVFSHGSDGVRIRFKKKELLSAFAADSAKVKHRSVNYKQIKDLTSLKEIKVDELPFLKRYPYKDEHEYRVVFVDQKKALEHQSYSIKLDWIQGVTLSPWLAEPLVDPIKKLLNSIDGCSKLSVIRSTLVNNETWKALTAKVDYEPASLERFL